MRLHHPLQFLAATDSIDAWHKVEFLRSKSRGWVMRGTEGLPGDRDPALSTLNADTSPGRSQGAQFGNQKLVHELGNFGQVT